MELCIWQVFLIKVNHSEMYTCLLSRLLIVTILKPLAGNYFPADADSQLKVHWTTHPNSLVLFQSSLILSLKTTKWHGI